MHYCSHLVHNIYILLSRTCDVHRRNIVLNKKENKKSLIVNEERLVGCFMMYRDY